jgi:hypothetical protein
MRELTKSMTSFSWAMSLFGLRQMATMLDPRSWGSTSSTFQAVTRCTEDQLGPTTQSLFRAGDNLQRGLVDLMFNLFTFGAWGSNRGQEGGGSRGWGGDGRSGRGQGSYGQGRGSYGEGDTIQRSAQWSADAMSRTAQAGADVMQQTAQAGADAVRQSMSGMSDMGGMGSNAGQSGQGWGPATGGGGR